MEGYLLAELVDGGGVELGLGFGDGDGATHLAEGLIEDVEELGGFDLGVVLEEGRGAAIAVDVTGGDGAKLWIDLAEEGLTLVEGEATLEDSFHLAYVGRGGVGDPIDEGVRVLEAFGTDCGGVDACFLVGVVDVGTHAALRGGHGRGEERFCAAELGLLSGGEGTAGGLVFKVGGGFGCVLAQRDKPLASVKEGLGEGAKVGECARFVGALAFCDEALGSSEFLRGHVGSSSLA